MFIALLLTEISHSYDTKGIKTGHQADAGNPAYEIYKLRMKGSL